MEINTYDSPYSDWSSDQLEIVDCHGEVVASIVEADEEDAEYLCNALNQYDPDRLTIQPARRERRQMRG